MSSTLARRITFADVPATFVELLDFYADNLPADACWPYPGPVNGDGYGFVRGPGLVSPLLAHRCALVLILGEIPAGLLVRHSCDNPPCINLAHLLKGTTLDNMRDMVERNRHRFRGMTPEQRCAAVPHFRRECHPRNRTVVAPDGRVWPSAAAAADALGLYRKHVARRCERGADGFRWLH